MNSQLCKERLRVIEVAALAFFLTEVVVTTFFLRALGAGDSVVSAIPGAKVVFGAICVSYSSLLVRAFLWEWFAEFDQRFMAFLQYPLWGRVLDRATRLIWCLLLLAYPLVLREGRLLGLSPAGVMFLMFGINLFWDSVTLIIALFKRQQRRRLLVWLLLDGASLIVFAFFSIFLTEAGQLLTEQNPPPDAVADWGGKLVLCAAVFFIILILDWGYNKYHRTIPGLAIR